MIEAIDALTGFKYIGEQIGLLEKKGEEERYIFGFEESYGYLTGSYVRDKDAVNGSLMICEMVAFYKIIGKSLVEVLNELYEKYGYCLNSLHSYQFEGAEGFVKMLNIMELFRNRMPDQLAGYKVIAVSDYNKSHTTHMNGMIEKINLPKSDVLKVFLEKNISVVFGHQEQSLN